MIKRLFVLIIYASPLMHLAQDFSALWKGHFSYNNITDVVKGNNKIFGASDNAVFSYDLLTNELNEITTINGLSGETISTIFYSASYQLLMIGYENGLIEIAFDNDPNILTIVDIIDKPTIPPIDKRINHFNALENLVYISTNYGISVYDLDRLEFGDTYFIGNSGSQTKVTQTTIFGDYIYAACNDSAGLRKALASSANLIDYQNWQVISGGSFSAIESIENNLYAISTNGQIHEIINDNLNTRFQYGTTPVDLRHVDNYMLVTILNSVYVYNNSFNLISQAQISGEYPTTYTSATVDTDFLYIGTSDFGILKTALLSPFDYEEIHPDGPLLNIPFSIQAGINEVWVTYGDYSLFYNPFPLDSRGISHLKGEEWLNIPYEDVLEAKSLNAISINPFKNSQVFVSSFINGLLEINEDVPTKLYNETNSSLEYLILPGRPDYIGDIRVGASNFDKNGLLWTVTSRIDRPLNSFNPTNNQWKSYSFTDIIPDGFSGDLGFGDVVIGNDETKWIGSFANGIIGFNENGGNMIKKLAGEEKNMPSNSVSALAIDKRNQLWIGTSVGLRVLYNTSNFFTDDNLEVDEIIILEDGIAKELLSEQLVTDIEVDGSNNKWIGTASSGLFYLSSDGQKTIFHFTTDNSPLPSNSVSDVSLDTSNGTIFIATTKGLVSFKSGSSSTFEDLKNTYAYPNPVRPTFNIVDEKVKIKDISENVNIKITDIEGNLVAEAQSRNNLRYRGYNLEIDGGTAYWNGKNLANNIVASGVYLIMLSDLDSFETKVIKLMVVR